MNEKHIPAMQIARQQLNNINYKVQHYATYIRQKKQHKSKAYPVKPPIQMPSQGVSTAKTEISYPGGANCQNTEIAKIQLPGRAVY